MRERMTDEIETDEIETDEIIRLGHRWFRRVMINDEEFWREITDEA